MKGRDESTGYGFWAPALRQEGEALVRTIGEQIANEASGAYRPGNPRPDLAACAALIAKVRQLMAEASEKGARHAVQYETLVNSEWHFRIADALLSEKEMPKSLREVLEYHANLCVWQVHDQIEACVVDVVAQAWLDGRANERRGYVSPRSYARAIIEGRDV